MKKTTIILLVIIFLFGLFLRIWHVDKTLPFFGDTDRDILVAKHIVLNKKFTKAAPAALGGNRLLNNSPHYFNFLSILFFFGKSPEGVVVLLALLSTINIILAFYAGKCIKGDGLGLWVAWFTAIHPWIVISARIIFQPNLLTQISIAAFCLLIIGFIKERDWILILSVLLFMFGLHIHYSILSIIPVLGLFLCYYDWKGRLSVIKLLPLMTYLLGLLAWLLTTNESGNKNIGFDNFIADSILNFIRKPFGNVAILERLEIFGRALFASNVNYFFILSIILLVSFFLIKNGLKQGVINLTRNTYWLLFAFELSIFVTLLSKDIYGSYYSPYYFIFLLSMVFVLYSSTFRRFFVYVVFIVLSVIFLRSVYLECFAGVFLNKNYTPMRDFLRNTVKEIIIDASYHGVTSPKNIGIIDKSSYYMSLGWIQPAYYYTLEEINGDNLVEVHQYFWGWAHNNIRPLYVPRILYLVCTEDQVENRSEEQVIIDCKNSLTEALRSDDDGYLKSYYRLPDRLVESGLVKKIFIGWGYSYIYRYEIYRGIIQN